MELVDEYEADLVVLARYMQVLSNDLCRSGRPGHQHPPLVPARVQGREPVPPGLRPRSQAGGRHAHYVTAELDEGPIIEQEVIRVDHSLRTDAL